MEMSAEFLWFMMYIAYKHELCSIDNTTPLPNDMYVEQFEFFHSNPDKISFIPIVHNGAGVGFIIIGNSNNEQVKSKGLDYFIEDTFILPDYRRKGLMQKVVQDYFNSHAGTYGMVLIDKNKLGKSFWHSVIKDDEWLSKERYSENECLYTFKKGN